MIRGLAIVVCLVVMLASQAATGPNPDVKAAIHVLPHDAGRTCAKGFPAVAACVDIVDTYAGCDDVDFFPVFFDLVEYQGFEYGVVWPGSGSCAFTSCSDLTIGEIVASGDGVAHAWTACQAGPVAITGWGWLSASYGSVCLVPHPVGGSIAAGGCQTGVDEVVTAYCAGLCGEEGDLYCWPILEPLLLSKTDGLDGECIVAGDSITYLISYDNSPNTSDVHNVTITDRLPSQTVYVSSTGGGAYDPGEHEVTWDIGTVSGGGEGSVSMLVAVPEGTVHGVTLINVCEIGSDETLSTKVLKRTLVCPDDFGPLGLTKDDRIGGECVNAGDTVSFAITYDNMPSVYDVHNAVLTDQLPAKVDFISCSAGGVYEGSTHKVTWDVGTIPGGAIDSVQVIVVVGPAVWSGLEITNTCRITSNEAPSSDADETIQVCGEPFEPLHLTKVDDVGGGCVVLGDTITYTISYDNSENTSDVHNVNLIDHLPPKTEFVSADPPGSYDAGEHTLTWTIGTLAGQAAGSVDLVVRVSSDAVHGASMSNVCEITGEETGASTAGAQVDVCGHGGNPSAKVAVHLEPHASRTCTKSFPTIAYCGDIQHTLATWDVDAFPVFFDLTEYQGLEYGLMWPGLYSCVFTSCSDLTIGEIVNPGDGISQAWSECQPGHFAVPGWAWIYENDPARICVVDHPEAGAISVADCHERLDAPVVTFCAGMAGECGDDPCAPMAVEPTSWGAIKAKFR